MIFISTSCLKGSKGKFEKSLKKILNLYAKLGITNIELGAALGYVDDLSIVTRFKKEHDANYTVHAMFPPDKDEWYMNIASQGKVLGRSIKKIKDAIEFARKIDAVVYGFHAGFRCDIDMQCRTCSKSISKEKVFETTAQSVREIVDHANKYDLKVCMENEEAGENFLAFNTADEFVRIFDMIKDKNFGMLLDIGHMLEACDVLGNDVKEFISRVQDRVFEMHIHSYLNGKTHHKLTDAHMLDLFDKDVVKKSAITLESNRLSAEDIVDCKKILEKANL